MRVLFAAFTALAFASAAHGGPWVWLSDEPDGFASLKAYAWDDEARGVLMFSCQHDTVVYSVTVDRYRDWDPAKHEGVTVPVTFAADGVVVADVPFTYWNQGGLATLRFDNTTEVFDDLADLLFEATERIDVTFGEFALTFGTIDKAEALAFVEDRCSSLEWIPD